MSIFDLTEADCDYTALEEEPVPVRQSTSDGSSLIAPLMSLATERLSNGMGRAKIAPASHVSAPGICQPSRQLHSVIGRGRIMATNNSSKSPSSASFCNKEPSGPGRSPNRFTKTNFGLYSETDRTAAGGGTAPPKKGFQKTNLGPYESLSKADSDSNWRVNKEDDTVRNNNNNYGFGSENTSPRRGGKGCCEPEVPTGHSTKDADKQNDYNRALARDLAREFTFVDTHAHIDFMLDRFNGSGTRSWKDIKARFKTSWSAAYEKTIADFCVPIRYLRTGKAGHGDLIPLLEDLSTEENSDVLFAFGCHPHWADQWSVSIKDLLCRLIKDSKNKCVALGEMGLDYSPNNSCDHEVQKNTFRQQLLLAKQLDLPVVIHSREAEDDCLAIMRECLPREHKIHRHCFLKSKDEAKKWCRAFPNCYFGLTPIALHGPITEQLNFLQSFRLDRILLETDSPYFCPPYYKGLLKGCCHPGMASCAAVAISNQRNLPLERVLQQIRLNTQCVYGV